MEKSIKLLSFILGLIAVVLLVQTVTQKKFAVLKESAGVWI